MKSERQLNYYQEKILDGARCKTRYQMVPLKDKNMQQEIDNEIKKGNEPPDGYTRELGFSQKIFKNDEIISFNSSLLSVRLRELEEEVKVSGKKRKHNLPEKTTHLKKQKKEITKNTAWIISRIRKAPELPISCLASSEHIVCQQDKVTDFISETEPRSKRNVYYQLIVKPPNNKWKNMSSTEHTAELQCMIGKVSALSFDKIFVTYDAKQKWYQIEVSTQLADIQSIVKILNKMSYLIIDCQVEHVQKNEGICIVKKDGESPIHALVNIAETKKSGKLFIERNAGATTGKSSFSDPNWLFNSYQNTAQICEENNYDQAKVSIVKLVNIKR